MNRKGFFKTIFGGFIATFAIPSLIKAEKNPQPLQDLALGRKALIIDANGNVGLGTNTPTQALHVSSIIFHINDRKLEMSGDENGDFKISWLDPKENETNCSIRIQKPKDDSWKTSLNQIR
jgi:hypothetical protein